MGQQLHHYMNPHKVKLQKLWVNMQRIQGHFLGNLIGVTLYVAVHKTFCFMGSFQKGTPAQCACLSPYEMWDTHCVLTTYTCIFPPLRLSTISATLLTCYPQSIPTWGGCIHQRYPFLRRHAPPKPRKAASARRSGGGGGGAEERDWNREAGDGGQGREGFFGKGANPITGSGAAPVSLATLNSHFNGLFLPLPIPFPSIFLPLPDTFSPFCYRGRHSRARFLNASLDAACFPNSLVQSWEERCRKKENLKGWTSSRGAASPYRCVHASIWSP